MKTLFNGARWVFGGRSGTAATVQTLLVRLLTMATNMGTGIITARVLEPVGRGEQAAMGMWPMFLGYAMTLGLPAALRYNLKRYPGEESELFSAALLMSTGLGIVATITGIMFIPLWLGKYSAEVIHFAQWLMLTAPVVLISATLVATLEAAGEFTIANQMGYLPPLITLAVLIVLALTHGLTPFTAALAYLLAGLPIYFWMLIRVWNFYHPRWRGLSVSYKRLTSYGLRAYGIDLLGTLSGQLDQALVISLLAPTSMGLYVVALSLSRMLNILQSSVVTVLLPKTAARPVEEIVALTGRAARISAALTFLAAIAVILVGPVMLHLLYGAKYMGAIPVFRILVIEVVVGGTLWVLAQAFMAAGRPGTVTLLQGLGLGLSVPLMLVLIPAYGVEGAGLALLGSTTARLVFVLMSYPLILKVRPPGLLITREDWRFVQQIIQAKKG